MKNFNIAGARSRLWGNAFFVLGVCVTATTSFAEESGSRIDDQASAVHLQFSNVTQRLPTVPFALAYNRDRGPVTIYGVRVHLEL